MYTRITELKVHMFSRKAISLQFNLKKSIDDNCSNNWVVMGN